MLRSVLFPALCVNMIMDTCNYLDGGISGTSAHVALLLEILLVFGASVFGRMPQDWLLPELAAIIGICVYVCLLMEAVAPHGFNSWLGYISCMPATFFVLGWHSSCILMFQTLLLSWIYGGPRASEISVVNRYACPLYSLMCMGGVVTCEYWLARLVTDLEEKSKATAQLLDRTTDGFGTLDASKGTILSASPSLAQSLVCSYDSDALVGKQLADFVDRADALQLQTLKQFKGRRALDFPPMLLTFNQLQAPCILKPLASFDATLIAFGASDSEIHICIRSLGELRPARFKSGHHQRAFRHQILEGIREDVVECFSDDTSSTSQCLAPGSEGSRVCRESCKTEQQSETSDVSLVSSGTDEGLRSDPSGFRDEGDVLQMIPHAKQLIHL